MGKGQAVPAPDTPAVSPVGALPPPAAHRGRRLLMPLLAWGAGAAAAVAIAVLAVEATTGSRTIGEATAAFTQQIRELEQTARNAGREAIRLGAAVETLNHDRDRLFARVAALEREVRDRSVPPGDADMVTGSIAGASSILSKTDNKTNKAGTGKTDRSPAPTDTAAPQAPPSAAAAPAADDAAPAQIRQAAVTPDPWTMATADQSAAAISVVHTEFALDLGAASTVNGLRRLWAAALKAHNDELAPLSPALTVRERPGGKVEFRLLAGPVRDAADAARLCAGLAVARRPCQPAVFDGQRLELSEPKSEAQVPQPRPKAAGTATPPRP